MSERDLYKLAVQRRRMQKLQLRWRKGRRSKAIRKLPPEGVTA